LNFLTANKLWRAILHHREEFHDSQPTILEISQFFNFQDEVICIFKISHF